jgi:hypothetical protein
MASIKIQIRTPDEEWTVAFKQPEITIGRGENMGLDIQLADSTVSRQHGRIWLGADGFWFEDSNSTYGSKKNGAIIMGPVRIFTGDLLTVGETTLIIEQADIAEVDLSELFDVHVQDRLHLANEAGAAKRPSAKIKIVAHQPWASAGEEAPEGLTHNFFGGLVNIFEYEDLNDGLFLAIEDIVRCFNSVERGVILLLDPTGQELHVAAHFPLYEPAMSTALVRKTIDEKRAFIWKADQSNFSSESIKKLGIKMGLYSPLAFGEQSLGVICAETTSSTSVISAQDLESFVNVTQVLSALIYAKQMELARIPE